MWRRKEKRKIIPNIVDTLFRSNAQGQRTHSAQTKSHPSPISDFCLERELPSAGGVYPGILTFLEKEPEKKAGVEQEDSSLENVDNDTTLLNKDFKPDLK